MCKSYVEIDASLIEINPLVVTKDEKLILLDAKINIDDNALYRQADIEKLKDTSEENDLELEASENDMVYIKLDGKIGCMVDNFDENREIWSIQPYGSSNFLMNIGAHFSIHFDRSFPKSFVTPFCCYSKGIKGFSR